MNNFMIEADNLASLNLKTNEGGPFGAVVVKDGKIVGRGKNEVLASNDPTSHAEVMAIRDACKNLNTYDLKGCTLYTSCFPCPMCLSSIIWSNIGKVYYGNTKEDAEDIGFRDDFIYKYINDFVNGKINKDVLDLECLSRDITIKTFEKYKEKKDKTIY